MNKEILKTIKDNSKILEKIKEERVFDINICENTILITENCDYWFSVELNKKEVLELSNVLKEIASKM